MSRITRLRPKFVEFIPEPLDQDIFYVSRRYSTASHLCCCGCGREVVTPLNAAKWHLSEDAGAVSLTPSVGNWSFHCKSHYWIDGNSVRWAAAMSPQRIAAVQARDRRDAELLAPQPTGRFAISAEALSKPGKASAPSWLGGGALSDALSFERYSKGAYLTQRHGIRTKHAGVTAVRYLLFSAPETRRLQTEQLTAVP